jgi:nucleoid-associated protein YgaU
MLKITRGVVKAGAGCWHMKIKLQSRIIFCFRNILRGYHQNLLEIRRDCLVVELTMKPLSNHYVDSDKFVFSKDGDRLDTLAYRYYGDTTLWWVIAKANGIKGKVAAPVDELLRIPGNITVILENFRKINRTYKNNFHFK